MSQEPICAIATALGSAGVAIVRVSGANLRAFVTRVFRAQNGKPLSPRRMTYGQILLPDGLCDQGMAAFFPAPHSYTGQDVLELYCHGGQAIPSLTLDACQNAGARLAEPGEFTLRAFQAGKIDLAQAEAVMQVVSAQSEKAARLSQAQLGGALSRQIGAIQDKILTLLAAVEASLDYPDDDLPAGGVVSQSAFDELTGPLYDLLKNSRAARCLCEGATVCICGSPNAGKSSLLNALSGQDRAIVTDIPGTTRDILSQHIVLGGVPVTLLDTAGLRAGGGLIEQIGIERAREQIQNADLILLVWDMLAPLTEEDLDLLRLDKPLIFVKNKLDLAGRDIPAPVAPGVKHSTVSAKTGEGIDGLKQEIVSLLLGDEAIGETALALPRHQQAAQDALNCLRQAEQTFQNGLPLDLVCIDLRQAWSALGLITGQTAPDELITRIFSTFCLGK